MLQAADPSSSVKDLKLTAKKALDKTKVVTLKDREDALDTNSYIDRDTVMFYKDTDSSAMIIHSSKLDTAARTGGSLYKSWSFTREDKNTWYEFRDGESKTVLGARVPLTGCLNSHHGDGGSITGTFSTQLGLTSGFDISYGLLHLGTFKSDLAVGISSLTSIKITGTYSCTVPGNSTGQMFLQPYFEEVSGGEIRKIEVKQGRSWKNPTVKKPREVHVGDWEPLSVTRYGSLMLEPIFTCVTDPKYLMCG